MGKGFLLIIVLVLTALSASPGWTQEASPQQAPAAPAPGGQAPIPPEAVKQVNPVRPTPESLARGKKDYGFDCAMCHGPNGDGKGDLAVELKLNLKDYRDPASLKGLTDGEIFYIIKNGKGEMTGEGDRRKADELWDMVNYLRSLSRTPRKSAAVK